MKDHDRQMQGGGHSSHGEAVGVVLQGGIAAPPFQLRRRSVPPSGQYFHWTMAAPMQRAGSEDLTQ
jgi:hypothetical protein